MFACALVASVLPFLSIGPVLAQEAPNAAQKPALVPGSPAPSLSIEKWVKGAPVAQFEKGKTYVVEFWATWCGPCIQSMPHLSALQRQYKAKGVTIIGVTSADPDNDLTAVEAMVEAKGEGMDYTVAWDSGQKTKDAYMKAAGRRGIPCSFVVDGAGKIAYIGHPMFLDVPLEQVQAGTWDIEKGNAAIEEAQGKLAEIQKAVRADPKGAVAKIAEFESRHSAFAGLLGSLRFDALLAAGDFKAAYACAGKLVDKAIQDKNPAELNAISWKIVDPAAKWGTLDLDLALRAAEKGVEFTKRADGAILDTLARVHYLKGDVKKAIEIQTLAVAASQGGMKEELEKTLTEYKAKASQ